MDRSYEDYQKYLEMLLDPEEIRRQVNAARPSPKFKKSQDGWQVSPFAGYTVITPPFDEDEVNRELYTELNTIGEGIATTLGKDSVGELPLGSFHLTLSDLVFGESYTHCGFSQAQILHELRQAFAEASIKKAPRLRLVGVCAPGSATIVVMDFPSKEEYEQVVRLRQEIYEKLDLSLRDYLAHISLFYKQFEGSEKSEFADILSDVNAKTRWDELPDFVLHTADLRFFPDMHRFVREDGWPRLEFGSH